MAWSIPWQILGLTVSGDVGGFTIYTDRYNRKVVFPKSPPEKPPSEEQIALRSRFTEAQSAWSVLNASNKAALEEACRKLSVPMTGQNLYIKVALTNDQGALETLERQSGITLPAIPYITT